MRRSLHIPAGSALAHLTEADLGNSSELKAFERLQAAGWSRRAVVLGSALEEQFYRLNNLPKQLAALYSDLDPADPDEDVVEEAEEDALRLVSQHYLLDETVDAFYEALATLPSAVLVRRPDAREGREATHLRGALLAMKHLFQDDWRADQLLVRLALTGSLAIDARPVVVAAADDAPDRAASGAASGLLQRNVEVWLDEDGAFTRVLAA